MSETVESVENVENAAGKTSRTVVGRVVSSSMDKTASVAVERLMKHPLYGKYVRRTSKVLVHDENNECQPGDTVSIAECRPISKRKAWRLIEVLERAPER